MGIFVLFPWPRFFAAECDEQKLRLSGVSLKIRIGFLKVNGAKPHLLLMVQKSCTTWDEQKTCYIIIKHLPYQLVSRISEPSTVVLHIFFHFKSRHTSSWVDISGELPFNFHYISMVCPTAARLSTSRPILLHPHECHLEIPLEYLWL